MLHLGFVASDMDWHAVTNEQKLMANESVDII